MEWAGPDGFLIQPKIAQEFLRQRSDVFHIAWVIDEVAAIFLRGRFWGPVRIGRNGAGRRLCCIGIDLIIRRKGQPGQQDP